ncbi:MAG TPA: hypothetical protein ENN19_04410 [Chloroflexi bacterium]|nr:hypothetical protein [Chloroflexota bacterium]
MTSDGDRSTNAERTPSPMEFGSMPLDPIYAWSLVLEPVEALIEHTSRFIEQLAREAYERDESFDIDEMEGRFLAFFDRLVEQGTLTRLPDAPPEMGGRILGPRRWLRAQRIRIKHLVEHWREHGHPDSPTT